MATPSSSELANTFLAWMNCIDQKNWDELAKYMAPTYVQDGIEFKSHQAFTAHVAEAEASLGKVAHPGVDTMLVDEGAQCLVAHVHLKCRPAKTLTGFEQPSQPVFLMEQRFVWFCEGKVSKIALAVDFDAVRSQLAAGSSLLEEAELDLMSAFPVPTPTPSSASDNGGSEGKTLESIYRSYIDSINQRNMGSELQRFCQPTVIHNGKGPLTVDDYRQLIQESISAIPDLHFGIHTVITDNSQQRVAARLEFTGTPVNEVAGLVPNGKGVRFSEHVTYQFVQGKISRVWSIVNWDEARRQLNCV